jgi:hypothetical protein
VTASLQDYGILLRDSYGAMSSQHQLSHSHADIRDLGPRGTQIEALTFIGGLVPDKVDVCPRHGHHELSWSQSKSEM